MLLAVHSALAALTRVPELNIEREEAERLADASKEVLKHYSIGLSDKQLAWLNLGVVGCGIYGTRIIAYGARRSSERQPRARGISSPAPPAPAAAQAPPTTTASGGGAALKVNGQAGNFNFEDLTPAWMALAPENEILP